jgi:hypothetical protein
MAALLALALALASRAAAQTFYVSPTGSDANAGTSLDAPFLTPDRANQAVMALLRPLTSDVRVVLRAGTYQLAAPLVLGPGSGGDSGTARVLWTRYEGDAGEAVLSGGATVQGWAPAPGAPAGIWVAPLPPAAPPRSRALFEAASNTRRWPARLPALPHDAPPHARYSDAATLHFTAPLDGSPLQPCWSKAPHNDSLNAWGFVFNASDARWPPASAFGDAPGMDVLVFGAWTAAWARVAAVHAHNSTLITATPLRSAVPGHWGGAGCPSGARYVLSNVKEALAASPGSFYTDDAARLLYYAALPGEDVRTASFTVPTLPTVLNISGDDCGGPLADVEVSGLSLRHTTDNGARSEEAGAPRVAGGVVFSAARDVVLRNCSLSSMDGTGVLLLGALLRISVLGCSIAGVGGDGIGVELGGTSEDALNTTIANNSIADSGMVFMNQPAGIRAQGAAEGTVLVAHNSVRQSTYAGIMVGWQAGVSKPAPGYAWQFVVEGNLVEDCGLGTLSDFGGIYVSTNGYVCERDEACYLPTLVRDNLVRGVRGYNYGGEGVYADENVAGVWVQGNALGNLSGTPIYLHCGDNETVVNNLLWGSHAASEGGRGSFATGLLGGCNSGGVSPDLTNTSSFVSTVRWVGWLQR